MGRFIYDTMGNSVDLEDRTLAHLRIAIMNKLRRSGPFMFDVGLNDGTGRRTLWIHPSIPLQLHFYGTLANPGLLERCISFGKGSLTDVGARSVAALVGRVRRSSSVAGGGPRSTATDAAVSAPTVSAVSHPVMPPRSDDAVPARPRRRRSRRRAGSAARAR